MNVLVSFHYYKDVALDEVFGDPQPNLMADSGAFSAATVGASIDLAEYAAWVQKWGFKRYANLDVIGDASATLANQHTLEDKGLSPMPVFHVGEHWGYLEDYLDRYDYVALGGLVPYQMRPKAIMPWLIKAFKMLPEGKGYHGFGTTGWTVMSSFPWVSVDSSSWGAGYRWGKVRLFSPIAGSFVDAKLGDPDSCFKHRNLIRLAGYEWEDLADRERNDRSMIAAVSAASYLRAQEWLSKRHDNKDFALYLAGVMPHDAQHLEGLT